MDSGLQKLYKMSIDVKALWTEVNWVASRGLLQPKLFYVYFSYYFVHLGLFGCILVYKM